MTDAERIAVLQHQQDLLLDAIEEVCIAANVCSPGTKLDGPNALNCAQQVVKFLDAMRAESSKP